MAFYSSSLFHESSDDSFEGETAQLEPLFDGSEWYSDEDLSSFSVCLQIREVAETEIGRSLARLLVHYWDGNSQTIFCLLFK
jgi:hypothetical protein